MSNSQSIVFIKNQSLAKLIFKEDVSYKDAKILRPIFLTLSKFNGDIEIDMTELEKIDYSVLILLKNSIKNKKYDIKVNNPKIKAMLKLVDDKNIDTSYFPAQNKLNFFARLGEKICDGILNLLEFSAFLGEFIIKTLKILINPTQLRFKEFSNYIKDAGVNAVFIVSLTAFLIGVVLAYLGSSMLANFGASIFIVEIMGILTLREVAPLIAAIVVAGRSASSFTAQIGVMKLTEEIDAMKTMGFKPFNFLVLPRIIAMVLCLPVIIFITDAVSIFGQMLVCENLLDISFNDYLARFKDMIEIRHFVVGMIKAPFFGAVIAIIGCMRGFGVSQSAQSLGEMTTISVVNAIFWVIALDAFFAIIFMWLEI
ncbi:ABC transporter permease [Campylobacter sp. RM9328]|uniref:MlaE family ABC transporter permease n=1 Tax=Campylobacter sp. RM9328 TaxID=1705720 RepID=UPI0020161710|nr:ABC transporter permease [Campylobacter sp. RM9328]